MTMDFAYGHAFTEDSPENRGASSWTRPVGSAPLFPHQHEVEPRGRSGPVLSFWETQGSA